jgi:hypothetical protein
VAGEKLVVYRSVSHVVSFNFGPVNARMCILEQDSHNAIVLQNFWLAGHGLKIHNMRLEN